MLYVSSSIQEKVGVQTVVLVHRHGDRTPVHNDFVTDDYPIDWPEGYGQLTGIGVHQLWDLGDELRENYLNLPLNYTQGLLYSRASDTDRTLQSAQSMLV